MTAEPTVVEHEATTELNVVGRGLRRLGAREKVQGANEFVADMTLPGMVYAKILRSPLAHARITRIETRRAALVDGVRAVLTYRDVPPELIQEEDVRDAYVLEDKARFVGDEVAAIAADTPAIAEAALALVDVRYEELPTVLTAEDALRPDAPLIPPAEVSSTNLLVHPARTTSREWGDVDAGLAAADRIYEAELSIGCVQHLPIEPKAFIAHWEHGKLNVWATIQRPFIARHTVARVLGLRETDVRVRVPYLGGGFGSKSESTRYILIAALLARQAQRPVKLVLTREEDMLARTRPANEISLKLGVNDDGSLTAIDYKLTIRSGGYNWCHTTTATPNLRALLRCPSCRFEGLSVYTNHPPSGQMRGVMDTFAAYSMATMIDTISEDLGLDDPMVLYRRDHLRPGDECGSIIDADGVTLPSCGLEECLDRAAAAIGWEGLWKGWGEPVEIRGSKRVGIGMSGFTHDSGVPWMVTGAVLMVNMDGSAHFFTPVTELGNGTATTQTQVVAEASGIPFDDIAVTFGDTDVTPVDPMGQVGSSTAHVRSIAAKLAGEDAKRQILERAAPELDAAAEELDMVNGVIFVRSRPTQSMTLKQLMGELEGGMPPVIGRGASGCPRNPQKAFNYGAHFALVEVDTETGVVTVLRYVAAHDVGRALNRAVVESQIQGGVVQGISIALNEELLFDRQGRPRNLNLTDYKVVSAADVPDVTPIIVESIDPVGAYGAKGFGEAPLVGTPACLANAIYNAIGVRFREVPITPERILGALGRLS